jgi:hypothetical protein
MKAYLLDLIPLSKIKYSKLQSPSFRKLRARHAVMKRGPFTIMFTYVSAVPWLMDSIVTALKIFPLLPIHNRLPITIPRLAYRLFAETKSA